MRRRRALALAVAGWAGITWGGRIRLLTGEEAADPVTWLRVLGSLAVAALATWALWTARAAWALWAYAVVTALVWVTSLVSVWVNDHDLGFRLVHTALATGSLALVALVVSAALRRGAAQERMSPTPAP